MCCVPWIIQISLYPTYVFTSPESPLLETLRGGKREEREGGEGGRERERGRRRGREKEREKREGGRGRVREEGEGKRGRKIKCKFS